MRYSGKTAALYLGGFRNQDKKNLLLKIQAENDGLQYLHWGDIDAGGFYIYRRLKEDTGIEIQPFRMGVEELRDDRYKKYCKPLSPNDKKRLRQYIDRGGFEEVIEYMLVNDVKLEQEIISLLDGPDSGKRK